MKNLRPYVVVYLLVFGIDSTIATSLSTPISISSTRHTSSSIDIGIEICGGSSLMSDFNEIEKTLPVLVEQISSLEELDIWLKSQECIQGVSLQDFLIKTNPPQRKFIVEFKSSNGSTVTKVINIFVLGDGRLQFNNLHDL